MKNLLRLLLKTQHQENLSGQAQTEKGMTLVELLVGAIMAFLIITPMLAFVVDMLNTDRREQVKSNTEQDIQAAVDFIAQDLSQAIHIYDGKEVKDIKSNSYLPPGETPILVFWKRKQIKNAVSIDAKKTPLECKQTAGICNDTYVRSLVAYYLVEEKDKKSPWCQPSGDKCPSRIERYEINEGVKDLRIPAVNENGYFSDTEVKDSERLDKAFDPEFNFSKPMEKVTKKSGFEAPQTLVNYIDHNPTSKSIDLKECQNALGNPQTTVGLGGAQDVPEDTLKVSNPDNSFYACVDTAKNIARITIRGNSLRRLQDSKVVSSTENAAFFPTATVQVQGRGALGK